MPYCAASENPINLGNDVFSNHSFLEGVIARMAKDDDKARSRLSLRRAPSMEKIVEAEPDDSVRRGACWV